MRTTSRLLIRMAFLVGLLGSLAAPAAGLQTSERSLLQLEVRDASGLPLPNAWLDVFAYAEGGLFREWLGIVPEILGPGVYLLRFSHEGFRPAVFSVPLRKEAPVSLRVQLSPETPRPPGGGPAEALAVNAIGLALDTRAGSDVIGSRRVVDRETYERTSAQGVAELFRVPSIRKSVGAHETVADWGIRLRNPRTGDACDPRVMVNGDMTLNLSFQRYQELYPLSEAEAIEFVLDGKAVPYTFRRGHSSDCPVLLIWLRGAR